MPFRYQLQKVLDLMETREKTIDAEVLALTAAKDAEAARLAEAGARHEAAQKGLAAQMTEGAVADVASRNDYLQFLQLKIDQQARVVAEAEKKLSAAVERQVKARQERQKIEKHKAMKLDAWILDEKKREAKRIDEMAGTIFMKRRNALEESATEESERLERLAKLRMLQALKEKRK